MILQCTCKHEFQDKIYGQGNRLMNPDKEEQQFTCTVCETKRSKAAATETKKKK